MTTALIIFGVAVNALLLVRGARMVWRLTLCARMPELWRLLENKGRRHRVRELRDEPRSNLPSTKYLYDEVDFDESDIREMKLTLKLMHRSAIRSVLLFGVVITATIALYTLLAY